LQDIFTHPVELKMDSIVVEFIAPGVFAFIGIMYILQLFSYETANVNSFEVPRMLTDDPKILEFYIQRKDDS